jgi:hypothetical protein
VRDTEWITVAAAASLMGVGHRQALRLLVKRNVLSGGRLLRKIGDKRMPRGVQPSKYLVSTEVFHAEMQPVLEASARDIDDLRAELVLINQKLDALRKVVRPLLRTAAEASARGTRRNAT